LSDPIDVPQRQQSSNETRETWRRVWYTLIAVLINRPRLEAAALACPAEPHAAPYSRSIDAQSASGIVRARTELNDSLLSSPVPMVLVIDQGILYQSYGIYL
jgi:hypothetical protein